jgi:hypothetical protein
MEHERTIGLFGGRVAFGLVRGDQRLQLWPQ